jgi:FkbM family methyltransferase
MNRLLPRGPTEVTIRSGPARGLRIVIDAQREKFYWTGNHEPHVQRELTRVLEPGMTFWDIGAHAGFFTMLASRAVGEPGAVHAFEPQPDNRSRLFDTVERNHAGNVTVHGFALSETRGEAVLHGRQASATWSLVERRGENGGVRVQCRTLDEVSQFVRAPDVIKIDVEGAELSVLQGGCRLLRHQHPVVIVEFMNEDVLAKAKRLLPDFEFTLLGKNHWLLQ